MANTGNTLFTTTTLHTNAVTISPVVNPTSYTDPSGNNFNVYTFTNTNAIGYTMTFSNVTTAAITLGYLAVGGGGGGSGGAGGMVENTFEVPASTVQTISIKVGAGAKGINNGLDTTIVTTTTITALGGGGGFPGGGQNGAAGGSGGGSGDSAGEFDSKGGAGIQPTSSSGGYGNNGGNGDGENGGGGGAGGGGGGGNFSSGPGAGGSGKTPSSTINGIPTGIPTTTTYARGGDGKSYKPPRSIIENTGNGGDSNAAGASGIVIISIPQ